MKEETAKKLVHIYIKFLGVILDTVVLWFVALATIFSLNVLFNMGIDYTFWTYLSMMWLIRLVSYAIKLNIGNYDYNKI